MKKNKFQEDNKWGTYFEWELNKFIEPYFNSHLNKKGQILSFTSLTSKEIYPKKNDWWRFDTLYNIYELDNPVPIKNVKFEIKTDRYDNTGNVCIEYKCSKKLSGVFHTEADYFIYYMPRYKDNNLYLFKPKDLVKYLSKWDSHLKYLGDGGRSYSYVFPKSEFDNDIRELKIGKLLTFECIIPEEFNVEKFDIVKNIVYNSNEFNIDKYDNEI